MKPVVNLPLFCIFFLLVIFDSPFVYGQITKGTVSVGSTFDYTNSRQTYTDFGFKVKSTEFELGILADYFVINNLALGVGFSYLIRNSDIDGLDVRNNGYFIGPKIEYFIPLSEKFYFSLAGALGYNSINQDDEVNELSFSGVSYGLRGSINYIVDKKIGAFFSVGPDFGTLEERDTNIEISGNQFEMELGVRFFF